MTDHSNEPKKETPRSFTEELNVAGNQLVERLQQLIKEGNIRRLILKDPSGRILLEVPLTLGVVGGAGAVFFAPFIAIVATLAAVVARVHVIVERYENPADAEKEKNSHTVVDVTPEPVKK